MSEVNRALIGFAGFGGPEIALREVGIEAVGIEVDPAIAEVNRRNGGNVIVADILDIDPADYIGGLLYHFSPPCPSFSLANHSSSESELDIALARKIAQFIMVGQPRYFTLENVWLYRKSKSWKIILESLQGMGYGVAWWHLNAADYGVPQTRKRMIVIARRDGQRPVKPWPTHSRTGDMFTHPWRGWHETIEDLIPDLPDSQFADWQMDRIPDELKEHYLVMTSNTNRNGVDNAKGRGWLSADRPANTVSTVSGGAMPKAFILNSQNSNRDLTEQLDHEPTITVTASDFRRPSAVPKAFMMASANTGSNNGKGTIRDKDAPMFVVTANAMEKNSLPKAFLVETGRVVEMTIHCLARFQDFPYWFALPEKRALACRGVGNALPPGVYRAVVKSLNL